MSAMNDQQRDYLRDLAKTAVQSALFSSIAGLPRWMQILLVVAGGGIVLMLLA
jgi:hypothetical protein